MGQPSAPEPALLFLGLLWTDDKARQTALDAFCKTFGRPFLETPPEPFTHTDYYDDEMGPGITRSYLFFPHLTDPGDLADLKLWTNSLEEEATKQSGKTGRPVNLDPGFLALDKLVLATTKERSHRIYIGKGIYAESTLHFHKGRYEARPWTYPDYARGYLRPVFLAARKVLKRMLKERAASMPPAGRAGRE